MNVGGTEYRVFAKDKASLVAIVEKYERYFKEGIEALRDTPSWKWVQDFEFHGWSPITEKRGSTYNRETKSWVENDRMLFVSSFTVCDRLNLLPLWEDPVCKALGEHPEVLVLTVPIYPDDGVDPTGQLLDMYESMVFKERSGDAAEFAMWMCGRDAA